MLNITDRFKQFVYFVKKLFKSKKYKQHQLDLLDSCKYCSFDDIDDLYQGWCLFYKQPTDYMQLNGVTEGKRLDVCIKDCRKQGNGNNKKIKGSN